MQLSDLYNTLTLGDLVKIVYTSEDISVDPKKYKNEQLITVGWVYGKEDHFLVLIHKKKFPEESDMNMDITPILRVSIQQIELLELKD